MGTAAPLKFRKQSSSSPSQSLPRSAPPRFQFTRPAALQPQEFNALRVAPSNPHIAGSAQSQADIWPVRSTVHKPSDRINYPLTRHSLTGTLRQVPLATTWLGGRGYTANGKLPATVQTLGTNDQNPTQSPARNLHRLGSRPTHLLPPSMGERGTPHTSDRQHQQRNPQHTRPTQTRRRMGKLPQPRRNRRPTLAQRHQRRQHRTRPHTPGRATNVKTQPPT